MALPRRAVGLFDSLAEEAYTVGEFAGSRLQMPTVPPVSAVGPTQLEQDLQQEGLSTADFESRIRRRMFDFGESTPSAPGLGYGFSFGGFREPPVLQRNWGERTDDLAFWEGMNQVWQEGVPVSSLIPTANVDRSGYNDLDFDRMTQSLQGGAAPGSQDRVRREGPRESAGQITTGRGDIVNEYQAALQYGMGYGGFGTGEWAMGFGTGAPAPAAPVPVPAPSPYGPTVSVYDLSPEERLAAGQAGAANVGKVMAMMGGAAVLPAAVAAAPAVAPGIGGLAMSGWNWLMNLGRTAGQGAANIGQGLSGQTQGTQAMWGAGAGIGLTGILDETFNVFGGGDDQEDQAEDTRRAVQVHYDEMYDYADEYYYSVMDMEEQAARDTVDQKEKTAQQVQRKTEEEQSLQLEMQQEFLDFQWDMQWEANEKFDRENINYWNNRHEVQEEAQQVEADLANEAREKEIRSEIEWYNWMYDNAVESEQSKQDVRSESYGHQSAEFSEFWPTRKRHSTGIVRTYRPARVPIRPTSGA